MSTENLTPTPVSATPAPAAPIAQAPGAAPVIPPIQKVGGPTPLFQSLKEKSAAAQKAAMNAPSVGDPIAGDPEPSEVVVDPAAPAFAPNYKFKAYEKEMEIQDEFFKGLIKDPDSQEKITKIHERAMGFDELKTRHTSLRDEHKAVSEKFTAIDNNLAALSQMVREGDMGSFFQTLNIPEDVVLDHATKIIQKRQASPDQRAAIERQEQITRENRELKNQNQQYLSQAQSSSLQTRVLELNTSLSRPDVQAFGQLLDAKLGAEAFKRAVLERGQLAFNITGQIIPADEAVKQAMALYAPFVSAQPNQVLPGQAAPASGAPQVTGAPQAPATPKPVLPMVSGGSNSPIKQGVRSIKDIKKRAEQLQTGS